MKNFALTGVAGYIAPRHLKAIKETNNNLIAALDPHDSVGILDQYFPEANYFNEFERFDRFIEMVRRESAELKIDYLTICAPNHLHDAHIRLALRSGADAICEKPLVLNPWNLDALQKLEEEYGKKVYTILQLRVHPALIESRKNLDKSKKHKVELTYITSRGSWYDFSWKGDSHKSGGIGTNIGIHFFDLLIWYFGKVNNSEVHLSSDRKMSGFLELEDADVKWFLSIDDKDLPSNVAQSGQRTYRSIKINDEELEFTQGFTDLHTVVYQNTLTGEGFGIDHARPSVELVHNIRNAKVVDNYDKDKVHPKTSRIVGKLD